MEKKYHRHHSLGRQYETPPANQSFQRIEPKQPSKLEVISQKSIRKNNGRANQHYPFGYHG